MEVEDHERIPSPSRKNHRSPSPDGGSTEVGESKRLKHHHHHRHHRHHRRRHHSKKSREKEEGDDVAVDEKADGVLDVNRAVVVQDDGELEEGEIIEEGEIKPETSNLVFSAEDNSYSEKEVKVLDGDLDALHKESSCDLMNHVTEDQHYDISSEKIDAIPRFGDAPMTQGKSSEKVSESGDSENYHTGRNVSINKDYDTGNGDLQNRKRSKSPFCRGIYAMKYKDRDEENETTYSDNSMGKHVDNGDIRHTPSRTRHNEVRHRNRSRSHDTDSERVNGDSRVDRHKVRNRTSNADVDRGHSERERSSSDIKRDGREARHGERDGQKKIDGGIHRERERSASYSRHSEREARPTDYDKVKYDKDRDINREHRRHRDRSSSISSLHDRERGRERERDRGSLRERDIEKPRDISRERYRERDRPTNVSREKERDRYGYDRDRGRNRDREVHLDEREHGRKTERDRVNDRDKRRDYRHSSYDERDQHRDKTRSKELAKELTSAKHDSHEGKRQSLREEDEEDYQERIEQQLAKHVDEDLDKIKEESRKRRQAILEKYKQQQPQKLIKSPSKDHDKENATFTGTDAKESAGQLLSGSDAKQDSSDVYVAESSFAVGKSPMHNGTSTPQKKDGAGGLGEGTPKSERSADMFCDDIFGESPVGIRKTGKGDAVQIERSGLHDNWDDAEGYYSYRFGEILDGRYEVIAAHGKGVFSTVVRAKDLKAGKDDPEEVAIKIIRNNDTMYKAGQEELRILGKLVATDPEDKRHCVRFLSSFKYRNHLCLIFESLHMNLREVLKKFGRNIGLKLTAVRAYAKQLFIALKHLKNCGVLHCDIKPDNMLVNEAKTVLKLCDFGNAMFAAKNEPTPYLVSRFYRAPEIILGLEYDHPLDIWSVGCCLYELYCGKVLFPGPSNNDMLRLHMELKGSFPKKMLRKGAFTNQHFDQDLNFHATEEDPVTRKTVNRLLMNIKPKDISSLISSSPGEDPKLVANFKDLLERIFILDPEKRMTVSQALSHPFITGK